MTWTAQTIGPPPLDRDQAFAQYRTGLIEELKRTQQSLKASRRTARRAVRKAERLEEQLVQADKLACLGLMTAGLAHELGNPLTAIRGYARIIKKDSGRPETIRRTAGAIEGQAARMEKIITDLLTFSRAGTDRCDRVRVNRVLSEAVDMLSGQVLFRGLELTVLPAAADPSAGINRDLLIQVLVNLVINAAQAGPADQRINLVASVRGERVVISVIDQGPGVPVDRARRIFEPFFTTKPAGQGAGLGLAMCRRILHRAGGNVRLANPGRSGAEFQIDLPRLV